MLTSRNLDDQSFEEIVRGAVGRLPWLCPQWTDHNAHDPGITVLELMAWYKEMQQYHMNQFTPELERKLLKLCSVVQRPAQAAVCTVDAPSGDRGRPALSRLTNQEEMTFELLEPIPERRPELGRMCVRQGERLVDVREMLGSGELTFQPFHFGGCDKTEFLLGFSELPEGKLRLWFEVDAPAGTPRTPFSEDGEDPRRLEWDLVGLGPVFPILDETHSLSISGYVELPIPGPWPETEPQGLHWLCVRLPDPGCEEQVRLKWVSAGRYRAAQQETRARSHRFTVEPGPVCQVVLTDSMAQDAALSIFLRTAEGWRQAPGYAAVLRPEGRWVEVDASEAESGTDNLLVVCLDPVRCGDLIFPASGRPGERIFLNLDGRAVLTESMALLCDTLDRDGKVRPMFWHCVEDFYGCGPRDRVFTYDSLRETLTFGDGRHGAVVPRGKGAVLVTDLVLSYCGDGNIPTDAGLVFTSDGCPVRNGPARGGRNRESVETAAARFLRTLNTTSKCVSARDYELRAKDTPGLRVAQAKALPGYDCQSCTPGVHPAVVTVVAIPDSGGRRPMPDERFLNAIRRHLERCRPICVRVEVIPPRYVDIAAAVQLKVQDGLDQREFRRVLEDYLSAEGAGIGGPVCRDAVMVLLQRVPGVLQVRRLDLHPEGADCYRTRDGDLQIPPYAVPCLGTLELELTRI